MRAHNLERQRENHNFTNYTKCRPSDKNEIIIISD